MILWHYYYYYYLRQIFQLTCITFELEEKSKSFLKIGLMKLVKRLNQMSGPMHEANSMQMHKQRLFLILSLNHATPFIRPFVLIVIMNVCGAACCLLVTDCLCAYLPMMVILCMWVFVWHRERDVITLVCGCTLERERDLVDTYAEHSKFCMALSFLSTHLNLAPVIVGSYQRKW